ncbi:hypothetical protein KI387_007286, partial [Taxus chinensis]
FLKVTRKSFVAEMAEAMIQHRLQEMAEQGLRPFVHRPRKLSRMGATLPSVLNEQRTPPPAPPRTIIKIKLKRSLPQSEDISQHPLKMFHIAESGSALMETMGSETLAKGLKNGSNSEEIEKGGESGSAMTEEMVSKTLVKDQKKRAGSLMRCHVKEGASRSTRFDAVFRHLKAANKKKTPLYQMKKYGH